MTTLSVASDSRSVSSPMQKQKAKRAAPSTLRSRRSQMRIQPMSVCCYLWTSWASPLKETDSLQSVVTILGYLNRWSRLYSWDFEFLICQNLNVSCLVYFQWFRSIDYGYCRKFQLRGIRVPPLITTMALVTLAMLLLIW